MIDIHCHILPMIDDGSEDPEESLRMAITAVRTGITDIVCTPHFDTGFQSAGFLKQQAEDAFASFSGAVADAGLPLRLHLGAEILCLPETPGFFEAGLLPTLAGSRYPLVEFPFDAPGPYMTGLLLEIASFGYTPLIAHPERYQAVQRDPDLAANWFDLGFLLQINKGSPLGFFGMTVRRTALALLEDGLVHIVASDAHGAEIRTVDMTRLADFLTDAGSPALARLLTEENPRRILRNEPPVPMPFPDS